MHAYHERDNSGVVSLVGLALVIVAGTLSIWWWSHAVWGDFSFAFLENLAPYIGYSKPEPVPEVGYQPPNAGLTAAEAGQPVAGGGSETLKAAPYCPPGEAPTFVLGFAKLHQQLGDIMGQPLECEHLNPANRDSLQQTSTGLAVYRPSPGQLSFTDGWRHWALSGSRLVSWEGDGPMPVTTTPTSAEDHSTVERARVAHSDGVGVILRSAPQMDARTPRGLAEGQQITIVGRQSSDWVHVRANAGAQSDGWVPSNYVQPIS